MTDSDYENSSKRLVRRSPRLPKGKMNPTDLQEGLLLANLAVVLVLLLAVALL